MTQARRLFLLLLCLAVGQVLVAQTYTSVADGDWNVAATWDANGVPPNPIPAGAIVEVNHIVQDFPGTPKTNNGTVNINADALLVIYDTWDNFGMINAKGGPNFSELRVVQSTLNNKAGGILQTTGPNASITEWASAIVNNEANALIEIGADGEFRLTFNSNTTLNNEGTIDNKGWVVIYTIFNNKAGGLWKNGRVSIINGATVTNDGQIILLSNVFSIQSTFTSSAGSSIEWVLPAAGTAGVDYPTITQTGTAPNFTTSTFTVSLEGGFEPNGGDQFRIYASTNLTVPTNPIVLPSLSGGKTWKETRGSGVIILEVEEPAPTDPGAALDFDGVNDLVQVNSIGPAGDNFTLEAWFKEEGGSFHENIVGWLGNRSGRIQQILVGTQPNGTLRYGNFDYYNFSFFQLNGTTNVRDGKWHHVAVTTTNGNDLALYVDGQLEATGSTTSNNTVEDYVSFLRIGAQGIPGLNSDNEHFTGKIDEVRIWGRALCLKEIEARYTCELEGNEQGLVAYYQFNEGFASGNNPGVTTLPDESGNGNSGTLYNFALSGSNSNWIAPGGVETGVTCEEYVNNPPTVSCPSNIEVDNDSGDCGAIVTFTVEAGATATPPSGSFFPVGTTTVEIVKESPCGDNTSCSFTVTVNDTENPSISCPADFSVDTDDGECGADVYLPAPGASDNCQVADVQGKYRLVDEDNDPISDFFSGRVDDPSGFLAVGRYQVNWRARDIYGNRDFCSYYVEVVDDEDPEAVCKDVTVNFNGEYSIDLAVSQVWNEAASSDNCGSVHYVGTSPSLSISCADLGSVVPLTVTIRDDEGNTDQCTADVTVTGLPCGWSEGDDDGSLNCAGNTDVDYDVNNESFAVSADGCWHDCRESDKAAYVYQTLCGDGTLTARLASINTKGYAGLMLRESLDPDARRAGALKNYSTRRVRREYRSTYGGIVTQSHSNRSRVKWFRIVRKGNEVKSYTSTNGSYWRLLYRVVFPNLEDCVYIGMMAYSSNTSSTVDAVFDNVSFSGSGNSLIDINTSLPNSFTILDHDLEINQAEVNIFPNPSSGQSQIELNGFSEAPAQIWIRDAFGKVVRQIELDYPDGAMLPLDLQDMPTGLYLISVMQEQQEVITKKLMIQK